MERAAQPGGSQGRRGSLMRCEAKGVWPPSIADSARLPPAKRNIGAASHQDKERAMQLAALEADASAHKRDDAAVETK